MTRGARPAIFHLGLALLALGLLGPAPGRAASQSFADFDLVYQERDAGQVAAVAECVAANLRAIQQTLGLTLRHRLSVLLYGPAEFDRIAPPSVAAQRSTAFYSITERTVKMVYGWTVARSTAAVRTDAVLRHELTHAVVHSYIGLRALPRWFDEGLAMHLEMGREWVAQQRLRVQQDARRNLLARMGEGDSAPYYVGVVAVDYLVERHGWSVVPAIMTRMQAGASFAAAFQVAVGQTPDVYEETFRQAMR
ncbi:MAG TPA: hypothetical protein VMC86_00010 [Gemmatimonadales bacterium]|nr:hypothetical protein [Gemmatimonadales bacterium]